MYQHIYSNCDKEITQLYNWVSQDHWSFVIKTSVHLGA